jgi:hypothetical protein
MPNGWVLEDRIYEWRQGRAVDQQEDRAKDQEQQQRRQNQEPPTFLSVSKKLV